MSALIDQHLAAWTRGKNGRKALVAVFDRIRDLPYSVRPELNHPRHYERLLEVRAGSCTPKHLLLAEMAQRLGWEVLLAVYPYSWATFAEIYPPALGELAALMPPVYHLACRVLIDGRYVLVDATIDPPLGALGLPVNAPWDGQSDTVLPVEPLAGEEIYHPSEARLLEPPRLDERAQRFYGGLNAFLERIRTGGP